MYTVAHFVCTAAELPILERIGNDMNSVRPGIFEGMRTRGDGFAVSVSTAGTWSEHWRAIEEFVESFASHIAATIEAGGGITLDVAVESEDYQRGPRSVVLSADTMRVLASHGVHFEVTVY